MKNNIKSKKGFTIIEVVLVLAIAGLIFLMVFIALPALQRSQRNTQRRDDYSMLVTAVNNYMASNNGKLSNLANLKESEIKNDLTASKWINSTGEDPNGNSYQLAATTVDKFTKNIMNAVKPGDVSGIEKLEGLLSSDPGSPVFIVVKANCSGVDKDQNPFPVLDSSARAFAVYGYLEGGSVFCQDSGSN